MRLFAKLLVSCLVIWLLIVAITGLFGISIQFPFEIIEEGEFPYHRIQTLRIALFLTLAYYGLQYVLGFSKEVYPISFVKIYIFNMCVVGVLIFYRLDVGKKEYLIIAFWLAFLLLINIATANRYKRLFRKK
jgi:hypothetical protein